MKELEEQISGLKQIPRAAPSPFLFTRILARVKSLQEQPVPAYRLAWITAGLALLLALNFMALRQTGINTDTPSSAGEYALNDNHFQLYQ